jgi:hypothetical protein
MDFSGFAGSNRYRCGVSAADRIPETMTLLWDADAPPDLTEIETKYFI